jgi:hypothetical protein
MKFFRILGWLLCCNAAMSSTITVGPWMPLFKGVELATGQQLPETLGELNQQVLCLRIDLSDPDIALFTTPKCTNCLQETSSQGTSNYLEQYGVQVAINGGFYASSTGPADTPLGTPDDVYGLAISQGVVVSPADDPKYVATLLFSTNNQAFFIPTNSPATNTAGIYTAISGSLPLLIGGTNVGAVRPNDLDPRTAFGVSADRRYLFLMTIDGRQGGWSDGADFHDTAEWLKRFGAADAINVDGGGSTTMVQAQCDGTPLRLNRSSYVATYGRERRIGHNFGVYAKPLLSEIKNLNAEPGSTAATITWNTDIPTTTQVEYGISTGYGQVTLLDSRLLRQHVATLSGLPRGTECYFRAISVAESLSLTQECRFSTLAQEVITPIFGVAHTWIYTTNNLDGVNWSSPGYNETNWLGLGPGLLFVEDSAYIEPKNTPLPTTPGQNLPRTYYFRTRFSFSGDIAGASLVFSNFVDDGAVFHLNGVELYRLRMPAPPTNILNSTLASGSACAGTARSGDTATNCADVFVITGDALTNLAQGENVLAVEVHNFSAGSPDIVFGSALFFSTPAVVWPRLQLLPVGNEMTFYWNEEGFTLQQSSDLSSPTNWMDVPGPVTQSPFVLTNGPTMFYRLRQ